MSAGSTPRAGWEFFAQPAQVNQRRYEALRAYFAGDVSLAAVAAKFGCTRATLA